MGIAIQGGVKITDKSSFFCCFIEISCIKKILPLHNKARVVGDLDEWLAGAHLQLRAHPQLPVVHPDQDPAKVGATVTKHDPAVVDVLLGKLAHSLARILKIKFLYLNEGLWKGFSSLENYTPFPQKGKKYIFFLN